VTAPEGFDLTLEDYPAYPGGTVLKLARGGRSRGWLVAPGLLEDEPALQGFISACAANFDED
jgi:hypothetical protein